MKLKNIKNDKIIKCAVVVLGLLVCTKAIIKLCKFMKHDEAIEDKTFEEFDDKEDE